MENVKKKECKYRIFSCILCALMIFAVGTAWGLFLSPVVKADAAEADILFMTDECQVNVGDTVYIDMTIIADEKPGNFEGYLNYTSDILEFVSGPDMIMGGEGVLRIQDFEFNAESNIKSYHLVFKAVKIGTAELSMRKNPSLYTFEDDTPMEVTCNRMKLLVNAAGDASSNALLADLRVSPGSLSPAFNADVKEYHVDVTAETGHLTISAVSADEKATVAVKGNDNLVTGENRIFVNVTAEDGKENEYVIYCKRAEKVSEETGQPENTSAPEGTDVPENTDAQPEVTGSADPADGKNTENPENGGNAGDSGNGNADVAETKEKKDNSKTIYIIVICILACALLMMIIININQRRDRAEKAGRKSRSSSKGEGSYGSRKASAGKGASAGKRENTAKRTTSSGKNRESESRKR